MLSSHMEELRAKLRTIEDSLRTNDAIRELLSTHEFRPLMFRLPAAQDAALRVKYHALNATTWRTLDHAAAMTSLYAAYERFVYDLLREWLTQVPIIKFQYANLQQGVRKAHRLGIANILQKSEHRRYQHLSLASILRDLAAASEGVSPYILLPEAFFSEDDNLRREALENLFARVGFQNTWHWIEKHPAVVKFIADVRGGGNTPANELEQFIGYRNDAAHGNIDDVLGMNAILDISHFIQCLCEAITEFVRHTLIQGCLNTGRARKLGIVTEIFHDGATAIGTMDACTIRLNDQVILLGQDQCSMATVISLRDQDVDCQEVNASKDQEVGIQFTVKVRKNMTMVRVELNEPFIPNYSI